MFLRFREDDETRRRRGLRLIRSRLGRGIRSMIIQISFPIGGLRIKITFEAAIQCSMPVEGFLKDNKAMISQCFIDLTAVTKFDGEQRVHLFHEILTHLAGLNIFHPSV